MSRHHARTRLWCAASWGAAALHVAFRVIPSWFRRLMPVFQTLKVQVLRQRRCSFPRAHLDDVVRRILARRGPTCPNVSKALTVACVQPVAVVGNLGREILRNPEGGPLVVFVVDQAGPPPLWVRLEDEVPDTPRAQQRHERTIQNADLCTFHVQLH